MKEYPEEVRELLEQGIAIEREYQYCRPKNSEIRDRLVKAIREIVK